MRKYDRTSIKNTIDKNIDKNAHHEKKKGYRWPDFVDSKLKSECYRIASLTSRFRAIYNENIKLFTEKHIVLQVFLSTCSMASCAEPRPSIFDKDALEQPWILNETERFILNFVKDKYPLDWVEYLHEGKGVQYWYPPVLGPTIIRLNPVEDDGKLHDMIQTLKEH